jgi:hypothetical protein
MSAHRVAAQHAGGGIPLRWAGSGRCHPLSGDTLRPRVQLSFPGMLAANAGGSMIYVISALQIILMIGPGIAMTAGIFILYRAVRGRTALIMFISQLSFTLYTLAMQWCRLVVPDLMAFEVLFMVFTLVNVLFCITFIVTVLELAK